MCVCIDNQCMHKNNDLPCFLQNNSSTFAPLNGIFLIIVYFFDTFAQSRADDQGWSLW